MIKGLSIIAATLVTSAFLVGCGSSDGGDSVVTEYYNGKFVDAGVAGIKYECGSASGFTLAEGIYGPCVAGTPVTFSVGNLILGTLSGEVTREFTDPQKTIVTPRLLAENAAGTPEEQEDATAKIAITLQSLDVDGDPTNGITITPAIIQVVNRQYPESVVLAEPEITVDEVVVHAQAVVATIVEETGNINMTAVDEETALAHLELTEELIDNNTITPPAQPVTPTGAVAEN